MKDIAVIGKSEFIVGFQLAGIRRVIETAENPTGQLDDLRKNKEIGIVIVDEKILENIDMKKRLEIEDSVEPVFIPVSRKIEHGSLRRLIKKSIGVDLWN